MSELLLERAGSVDAPFGEELVRIGRERPDVVVLSADLSKYTDVLPFAESYPERFIQVGMAEQNMLGIAGGLAKSGLLPIAVTYGVFATRRACDQLAMALNTGDSKAIVVGFLPGITTPFRATHQATDDLAIARAIPGLTVIDPVDATDVRGALRAAVAAEGTVYLRGLRGAVAQVLDPQRYTFSSGDVHWLRRGADVGIIGTGLGTNWALETSEVLARDGINAAVLHAPTVKPLDELGIVGFCDAFTDVVTIENHSTIGGLGDAIAAVLAAEPSAPRLLKLGVADRWGVVGGIDHIRRELGLDPEGLAASIRRRLEEGADRGQH